MRIFRRAAAALLLLAVLLSAAACSTDEKTVLTAEDGKFAIRYDFYRYVVLSLRDEFAASDPSFGETDGDAEKLTEETFRAIRQYYAVLSLAAEYGIKADSPAVRQGAADERTTAVKNCGGEDAFRKMLAERHMTEDVFSFLAVSSAMQNELYYKLLNDSVFETDEAALRAIFTSDEVIRVKQVLIDPSRYESREQALATATLVRDEAVAGADFDTLVNTYGADLFMFHNADGYYLFRGVWYKEFEDAAFALTVGDVSDVIETPAGFSVLTRLEKSPAYLDSHFDDLKADYYDACFSTMLEARATALSVETTAYYDKHLPASIKE